MLEDSLFESQGRKTTRKPATVASIAVHAVTIVVLVLIPLLRTQAITILPPGPADMSLWIPQMEPRILVFSAQPRVQKYTRADPGVLAEPRSIPARIAYIDEPANPNIGFLPPAGAAGASLLKGILDGPIEVEAPPLPPTPPPTPPPPPQLKTAPIRVSNLKGADLIEQVQPVYPPLARQTRTQGVVVLEATISTEGSIESLRVVSGHPLLTQAALDAVKRWKYRPLLLNGEAVAVITTITVTFTLQ